MADCSLDNKSKLWYILEELEDTEEEGTDWLVNIESNKWDTVKSVKSKTNCTHSTASNQNNLLLNNVESNQHLNKLPNNVSDKSCNYLMDSSIYPNFQKQLLTIKKFKNIHKTVPKINQRRKNVKKERKSLVTEKNQISNQNISQAETSVDPSNCKESTTITETINFASCLYSRGNLVYAKIVGYSFWPAMVDDDPDTKNHYWVDDISKSLTHYHVVFFDTQNRLSRSWVKLNGIKPFTDNFKCTKTDKRYKESVRQAVEASCLSIEDRLKKFGFMSRFQNPKTILCDS